MFWFKHIYFAVIIIIYRVRMKKKRKTHFRFIYLLFFILLNIGGIERLTHRLIEHGYCQWEELKIHFTNQLKYFTHFFSEFFLLLALAYIWFVSYWFCCRWWFFLFLLLHLRGIRTSERRSIVNFYIFMRLKHRKLKAKPLKMYAVFFSFFYSNRKFRFSWPDKLCCVRHVTGMEF